VTISSHEIYEPELFRQNIFVFGSNLAGRHGAGAALWAARYAGAIYGDGYGLQGRSFAIPTKDHNLITLDLEVIQMYVHEFVEYALHQPEFHFYVTPIGCGLAGHKPKYIAPMFEDLVGEPNVTLPKAFSRILRP